MTEIILGQVQFVLVTALLGMILMAGYDIWRFLRWLIPHHKIVVMAEDIIYWSIMSIPAYIVFFIYNEGEIRWYGALAILIGGILYEKGISQVVRRFGYHHFTKPKNKLIHSVAKLRKWIPHRPKKSPEEKEEKIKKENRKKKSKKKNSEKNNQKNIAKK